MQPVSEPFDLSLDNAWGADHRGGVKNSGTRSYLLNCCCAMAGMIPEVLHPVPVGIVPGGHRLADARRAVAEADVAIALARIAEFCESTMFEGFDYGGAWARRYSFLYRTSNVKRFALAGRGGSP
jgi:hypothetical protein